MFKKAALILTAFVSLTIANVSNALPVAFLGHMGKAITEIPPGTIHKVNPDGRTFQLSWVMHMGFHGVIAASDQAHEGTFNVTDHTAFSGGSRANLVKGAHVQVTFHFEGSNSDAVIADTVQFLAGS